MTLGRRSDEVAAGGTAKMLKLALPLLALAAFLWILHIFLFAWKRPLSFDDSYMFYRYALHLREGMGLSWNGDGVHTAGMTSIGWFAVVFLTSLLPLGAGKALLLASFATGLLGIVLCCLGIAKLSRNVYLKQFLLVCPLLAIFLVSRTTFRANLVTGMDTMLSFASDAVLACAIWSWCEDRSRTWTRSVLVGLLGALSVIVRPENGLFAVLCPALAAFLLLDASRRRELVSVLVTFSGAVVLYAVAYRGYFHVWMPLSFYMKSGHAYQGYIGGWQWDPRGFVGRFLQIADMLLAVPLLFTTRRSRRIAACYLIPVVATMLYLQTVMQIMGAAARYYVPFLAPVTVAAAWMADTSWREGAFSGIKLRPALVAGLLAVLGLRGLAEYLNHSAKVHPRAISTAYAQPVLVTAAAAPLPEKSWWRVITLIGTGLVRPLPAGSTIAASEVGYIGAVAPRVNVIDLAGLNDSEIALHGFDMDRFLDRKPALIWFPHSDYTGQRYAMLCSPRLLREYVLIGGGAFDYSLAIRRGTPETADILAHANETFQQLYPGVDMQTYVVSSIGCLAPTAAVL